MDQRADRVWLEAPSGDGSDASGRRRDPVTVFPAAQLPAFKDLARCNPASGARGLKFDLGHQLVEEGEIPARVLVMLQGQARLVGEQRGRMTTVGKFGPGSILGAASLLCGHPCENVVAAQEVVAAAIPDETWLHLYETESSFRRWCDGQLWPQELQSLLETLIEGSANAEISTLQLLQTHYKACRHCASTAKAIRAAQDEGGTVFLSSWESLTGASRSGRLGCAFVDRFAPRLVALPQEVMDALGGDAISPPRPARWRTRPHLDVTGLGGGGPTTGEPCSPERNVVDGLRQFVPTVRSTGNGLFSDAGAAGEAAVRRDSIEKVLRDNLRRGLTPTSSSVDSWPPASVFM